MNNYGANNSAKLGNQKKEKENKKEMVPMVLCAGEVDCNTKQDMLFLDYYFLVTIKLHDCIMDCFTLWI